MINIDSKQNIQSVSRFENIIEYNYRKITNFAKKVFSIFSNIYKDYFYKNGYLEGRCQNFLSEKFYKHIQSISELSNVQNPEQYKSCILKLRKIINDSDANKFFSQNTVWEEVRNYDLSKLDRFLDPNENLENLDDLSTVFEKLYNKLGDGSSISHDPFDPILFGNLPFPWYQYKKSKLLRIAVPTIDNAETELCPIFLKYIESLKKENKRHVYINLMDRCNPNNEKLRSDTVENNKYPDTLIYVALDKTSTRYQKSQFNSDLNLFKDELKQWLLDENFHLFPKMISKIEIIDKAIVTIGKKFNWPNILDKKQKASYIDLCHLEICEQLLDQLEPESFNMSCKNCIDRGGSMQALFVSYQNMKNLQPIWTDELSKFVLTIPYLVSGRMMQKDRFDRLIDNIKILSNSDQKQSPPPSLSLIQKIKKVWKETFVWFKSIFFKGWSRAKIAYNQYLSLIKILKNNTLSKKNKSNLEHLLSEIQDHDLLMQYLICAQGTCDKKHLSYIEKLLKASILIKNISTEKKIIFNDQLLKIANSPEKILNSSIDLRIYCLSLYAKKTSLDYFQICQRDMESSLLEKTKYIVDKIKLSNIWNSRQILFHTNNAENLLETNMGILNIIIKIFFDEKVHSAHILKKDILHINHLTVIDHKNDPISTKDLLTSAIIELDVAKLAIKKFSDTKIKKLNNRLSYLIEKQTNDANELGLKNSHTTRIKTLFYRYLQNSNKEKFKLEKNSYVQCCHYVAANLHQAVETLNEELQTYFKSQDRILHPLFDSNIHPKGILPDYLFEKLSKFGKVISQ